MSNILELIASAKVSDLEVIDQQINEKKSFIQSHEVELKKLARLRRMLNEVGNGRAPRKVRSKKVASSSSKQSNDLRGSNYDRQRRIARYLAENGATKTALIAVALNEEMPNVNYSVSNSFFAKTPQGVVLTPEGRSHFLES